MAIHYIKVAGFCGIAGIVCRFCKNICVNFKDSALFCFFTVKWIASVAPLPRNDEREGECVKWKHYPRNNGKGESLRPSVIIYLQIHIKTTNSVIIPPRHCERL